MSKFAFIALVVGFGLLGACGDADDATPSAPTEVEADNGTAPQRVDLEGADASVLPPAGLWMVQSGESAPGQWYEQHRREESGITLQVLRFPAMQEQRPSGMLPRLVDSFVRALGTDGYGQTARGADLLWGAPMAWLDFAAMVQGSRVKGRARLVRLPGDLWAFAGGVAPDGDTAGAKIVRDFVDSLEPNEPAFYERSFAAGFPLDDVIIHVKSEEPVTKRDLAAVALVLEATTGQRFPLQVRPAVMDALADEAKEGSAASRRSFRETSKVLDTTHDLTPAQRELGMKHLGARILEALLKRAASGYLPAAKYQHVWQRMGAPVVGTKAEGLSAAGAYSLHEMGAFLASIAADREVPITAENGARFKERLAARWEGLDKDARLSLRGAGAAWAKLRYAWDRAKPEAKLDFRRAVLTALAGDGAPKGDTDDRGMLTWMHAHAEQGAQGYLDRATELPLDALEGLRANLGVDATGYELGW